MSRGQLSLRRPEQTAKAIQIVLSALKTGQLLKYLLRGYKCLVCLVMSACINGLPSLPEVTYGPNATTNSNLTKSITKCIINKLPIK